MALEKKIYTKKLMSTLEVIGKIMKDPIDISKIQQTSIKTCIQNH